MRPRPRPFFFRPWGYRRYYGPGYGRGGCLGCTLPILLLALTVIAAVAGGGALLSGAFF